MFQMFSNPKTHKNHQSTSVGLGLAYCQAIVEKFKGSISCESREGVGSKFTVGILAGKRYGDRGLSQIEELNH